MSNTRRMKGFHFSINIALTIYTAKSLTPTQKLQNFIWCYSISCLSLCLDQLIYIVVVNGGDAHSSEFFIYILISTFSAKKRKFI